MFIAWAYGWTEKIENLIFLIRYVDYTLITDMVVRRSTSNTPRRRSQRYKTPELSFKRRQKLNKYYTCPRTVKYCIETLKKTGVKLGDFNYIVEPAAGDGGFLNFLRPYSQKLIAVDIHPEHDSIAKMDFLQSCFPQGSIVVGNPPFGKGFKLAKKFIEKAITFADTIAFILPSKFDYSNLRLKELSVTPLESVFYIANRPFLYNCSFYVWKVKGVETES